MRSWLSLFVPLALLAAACGGQGSSGEPAANTSSEDETDAEAEIDAEVENDAEAENDTGGGFSAEALHGLWSKETADECAPNYPDQLVFKAFGYTTSVHDDRAPMLDGGSYEVVDSVLRLSNPIDAMVDFDAVLIDGMLTLDDGSCQIVYRQDFDRSDD